MEQQNHWNNIYSTKSSEKVSWFQDHANQSLNLISETGVEKTASIIDVGGGASTLVDDLLKNGYENLTILDISESALGVAKNRLGESGKNIKWLVGDITEINLPKQNYDVWHDRAVFHFLNEKEQRISYIKNVFNSLKPGGHIIVSTFAEDGPLQCSGLPVSRYSADELHAEFGNKFKLIAHNKEKHITPAGNVQMFVYCYCRLES